MASWRRCLARPSRSGRKVGLAKVPETSTGTTRRAGKEIHITITDNGPGIPPEHLARVFDPFFTTKDPGQGTGLGLAISFQIIEKMGGRLLLENVTPRGSRATVILPVVIPEPK